MCTCWRVHTRVVLSQWCSWQWWVRVSAPDFLRFCSPNVYWLVQSDSYVTLLIATRKPSWLLALTSKQLVRLAVRQIVGLIINRNWSKLWLCLKQHARSGNRWKLWVRLLFFFFRFQTPGLARQLPIKNNQARHSGAKLLVATNKKIQPATVDRSWWVLSRQGRADHFRFLGMCLPSPGLGLGFGLGLRLAFGLGLREGWAVTSPGTCIAPRAGLLTSHWARDHPSGRNATDVERTGRPRSRGLGSVGTAFLRRPGTGCRGCCTRRRAFWSGCSAADSLGRARLCKDFCAAAVLRPAVAAIAQGTPSWRYTTRTWRKNTTTTTNFVALSLAPCAGVANDMESCLLTTKLLRLCHGVGCENFRQYRQQIGCAASELNMYLVRMRHGPTTDSPTRTLWGWGNVTVSTTVTKVNVHGCVHTPRR